MDLNFRKKGACESGFHGSSFETKMHVLNSYKGICVVKIYIEIDNFEQV